MSINITDVVYFEKGHNNYCRVEPFTATIKYTTLSEKEKALIRSAIANVGHEIRRLRGVDAPDPFYYVIGSEVSQ